MTPDAASRVIVDPSFGGSSREMFPLAEGKKTATPSIFLTLAHKIMMKHRLIHHDLKGEGRTYLCYFSDFSMTPQALSVSLSVLVVMWSARNIFSRSRDTGKTPSVALPCLAVNPLSLSSPNPRGPTIPVPVAFALPVADMSLTDSCSWTSQLLP